MIKITDSAAVWVVSDLNTKLNPNVDIFKHSKNLMSKVLAVLGCFGLASRVKYCG